MENITIDSNQIDQVLNEFIKYGSDILLSPLLNFFNRILTSGTFPDALNISLMTICQRTIMYMSLTAVDVLV